MTVDSNSKVATHKINVSNVLLALYGRFKFLNYSTLAITYFFKINIKSVQTICAILLFILSLLRLCTKERNEYFKKLYSSFQFVQIISNHFLNFCALLSSLNKRLGYFY